MDKPLGKSIVIVGYVLTFVFGDKFLLSSCSRLGTLYYKYDRKVLRMLPPFLASSPSAILEKWANQVLIFFQINVSTLFIFLCISHF